MSFSESGFIGEKHTIDSLFSNYVVPLNPNEEISIYKNWWIKFLLIISLFIFIGVYLSFLTELPIVIKALFNKAFFRQIIQQHSSVIKNLITSFNIIFFLSISVIIYLYLSIAKSIFLIIGSFVLYLLVLVSIVIFHFLKIQIAKVWSYALDYKQFSKSYLYSVKISNVFLSTFLLFFIFSSLFNPFCKLVCIKIALLLVFIVFIIRLWRIFYEFFQQGFSLFYLILYLCTVEILPPLVVIKVFSIV